MFEFIKRLFKKEETEDIPLGKLEEWFQKKSDAVFDGLSSEVGSIKNEIEGLVGKTRHQLEILEKAGLRNTNITIRERQFMDGNRSSYIKAVHNLLSNLNLSGDYDNILNLCGGFSVRLNSFAKATNKSYHILQEFLANESKDIAMSIKGIDKKIGDLRNTIHNSKIDNVGELKEKIISTKKMVHQKGDLKKERIDTERKKEDMLELKRSIEAKINELKSSQRYESFRGTEIMLNKVNSEFKDHVHKLHNSFSILEHSLRKYARLSLDAGLLDSYINDCVSALKSDAEFKIVDLLEKTKQNILNNNIEMKDKRRDKTLDEINKLDRSFLKEFLERYNELKSKHDKIELELKESDVKKELAGLEGRLEESNKEVEKTANRIDYFDKEINKIDIQQMKADLGKEINSLLNVDVVIS